MTCTLRHLGVLWTERLATTACTRSAPSVPLPPKASSALQVALCKAPRCTRLHHDGFRAPGEAQFYLRQVQDVKMSNETVKKTKQLKLPKVVKVPVARDAMKAV